MSEEATFVMGEDEPDAQATAVQSQMFERLKKLRQFLESAQNLGIDFEKLGPIGQAIKDAIAAVGVEAQVNAWLKVCQIAASATKTPTDDAIVANLQKLADTKIVAIIVDLIDGWLGKASKLTVSEANATAEAAAIPWTLILMIAKFLFSLMNNIREPKE